MINKTVPTVPLSQPKNYFFSKIIVLILNLISTLFQQFSKNYFFTLGQWDKWDRIFFTTTLKREIKH